MRLRCFVGWTGTPGWVLAAREIAVGAARVRRHCGKRDDDEMVGRGSARDFASLLEFGAGEKLGGRRQYHTAIGRQSSDAVNSDRQLAGGRVLSQAGCCPGPSCKQAIKECAAW